MRVWVTNDFTGYRPVGTAAVVVAESLALARRQLNFSLEMRGLPTNDYTLSEVDIDHPDALILCDGNY